LVILKELNWKTRRRSRSLPVGISPKAKLVTRSCFRGNWLPWRSPETVDLTSTFERYLAGSQVTEDQRHPLWRTRESGSINGDLGGPFFSVKKYCSAINGGNVTLSGVEGPDFWGDADEAIYTGPFLPCSPSDMQFPPDASSSDEHLIESGTVAIQRCSPSKPVADLSVMLGELVKDGIPKMIGASVKNWLKMSGRDQRQAVGSEYLNVEFGFKPLARDLASFADAVTRADAIWRQYERDAGKVVRRGYSFKPFLKTEMKDLGVIGPWVGASSRTLSQIPFTGTSGTCFREHSISKRQWFKGAFTYYLPRTESVGSRPGSRPGREDANRGVIAQNLLMAKKLYGLTFTPDVVWALMPWSWLFDWVSNTSEVLKNWASWAMDGQVLVYGYMMEHTISTYTYTWVGNSRMRSGAVPYSVVMVTETKKRIKATPYGFGVDWEKLTPSQTAIIAALGLSKSK
jgi:hypothetical protein